jgi:hypothetical protein
MYTEAFCSAALQESDEEELERSTRVRLQQQCGHAGSLK